MLSPQLGAPGPLDWSALRAPFTLRGVRLDDRDTRAIEQNWWSAYSFYRNLGFKPSDATWAANKSTPIALDNWISRQNPNQWDRFEQDWERDKAIFRPGQKEFRTPIVPIMNDAIWEWIKGKF